MERSGLEPDGDGCKDLCRRPARPQMALKFPLAPRATTELGGLFGLGRRATRRAATTEILLLCYVWLGAHVNTLM